MNYQIENLSSDIIVVEEEEEEEEKILQKIKRGSITKSNQ